MPQPTNGGATPTGGARGATPTPADNLNIKISKQDVAGKELAKAELSLTSLDGYDLSGVFVTQGDKEIMPRLSADKKTLAFDTVDTSPSIVRGLKAGRYELRETVTPEAYKTADAIEFTLRNDGSADCRGQVVIAGSPIIMVDQADPTYKVPNKPNLPSTGEEVSPATVIGIITILAAVCLAGTGVYRIKKKKN